MVGREEKEEKQIESKIKLPKEGEVFGYVDELLGCAMMRVVCSDGKIRLCRVPGSKRRIIWVRQGDIVLVRPWEVMGDERGDIIDVYTPTEINWLRKKGYLKELDNILENVF